MLPALGFILKVLFAFKFQKLGGNVKNNVMIRAKQQVRSSLLSSKQNMIGLELG